jgi:peptidoglycan/LPS O-acetylase OafA/YrhL
VFPIWIGGFLLYRFNANRSLPQTLSFGLFAATIAIPLALLAMTVHSGLHMTNSYATRYATAIVFALNIAAVQNIGGYFGRALRTFERPIAWCAGMTFSLYLFHLPVAQFLTTLVPWAPQTAATRLVIVGGTFLIVALLAALTERRKSAWRDRIAKLFSKMGVTGGAPRSASSSS